LVFASSEVEVAASVLVSLFSLVDELPTVEALASDPVYFLLAAVESEDGLAAGSSPPASPPSGLAVGGVFVSSLAELEAQESVLDIAVFKFGAVASVFFYFELVFALISASL
jgi:hypothetical protein